MIGALDGHAGGGTQGLQPSLRACPGLETEPQTGCIPQLTIGRKKLHRMDLRLRWDLITGQKLAFINKCDASFFAFLPVCRDS